MRKKVATKEEIIKGVLCVIQKKGISDCSVRAMAKELDIAVGTLYNYFGSREEMIIEAFNLSWKGTMDRCQTIAEGDQEAFDKIMEVFTLIHSDVKKRNGLGKEVKLLLNDKQNIHFIKVKQRVCEILEKTIKNARQCDDPIRKEALSRWLTLLVFDSFNKEEPLNKGDIQLIKELIQSN